MKKAVIFDMDGVIIDSQPLYFQADREALGRCGKTVDAAFVENYAGISNLERWMRYKADLELPYTPEYMADINTQIFEALLEKEGMKAIPGIPALTEMLYNMGLRLAVASSSPIAMIKRITEGTGINKYFSRFISGESMQNSKPDPEIFLKTAAALALSPMDCVIIEDSHNGVTAANRAAMKCIAYRNINSGAQDLSGAQLIVDSFDELTKDFHWLE